MRWKPHFEGTAWERLSNITTPWLLSSVDYLCFHKVHYIEILTLSVMVFGAVTVGRWLGHEGGVLVNRISALIKGAPKSSLTPSTRSRHSKKTVIYKPGSEALADTKSTTTLILDLLPPKLWEISVCCLETAQSIVFCYSSSSKLRQLLRNELLFCFSHHGFE
jgi:hypothetical protein